MRSTSEIIVMVVAMIVISGTVSGQDLQDAIENGRVDEVNEIIASDSSLIHTSDKAGTTPLHIACRSGQVEIAGLLIDAGSDLDTPDKQGMTPLREAIRSMHTETVKLLLEHGAGTGDNHPMYGSLINQAFMTTCQRNGSPEMVGLLIDYGLTFDAGQVDAMGMSPLDWATHFGNLPMARLAIDHGADVNLVSPRLGRPTLIAAVSKGNDGMVKLFLENGADASIGDQDGIAPIFYAVDQGRTTILEELLDHGASAAYIEPHYGRSLLHLAAIKGFRDIAERLVTHGADIMAPDRAGRTPLYYAARYRNPEVANYLIEKDGQKSENTIDDYEKSGRITDGLGANMAEIWYLNNRGWTVRTKSHTLIFDAEEFEIRRSDNPCLANGFLTAEELREENVISLFSCYHGNPGEPAYIHQLSDSLEQISYVHLIDDAWRGSPNTTYLKGRSDTTVAGIKVQTIDIADYMPMLAYLCHADGLIIYYQAFGSDDPKKLRQSYDFLGQFADTVDIAFLPIPEAEAEKSDIRLFLERFPTRTLVLLDTNRREYMYPDAAGRIAEWGYSSKVLCVENPGDRFDYPPAAR